jgi:hypothetical protein
MYGCARRVWEQITIETKINIKLKRGFIVAPSTVLIFFASCADEAPFQFPQENKPLKYLGTLCCSNFFSA